MILIQLLNTTFRYIFKINQRYFINLFMIDFELPYIKTYRHICKFYLQLSFNKRPRKQEKHEILISICESHESIK